jgi:hypothetical protein
MDVFRRPKSTTQQPDTPYLEQSLRFEDGKILDSGGWAVMMQWEEPLMVEHARYICWADSCEEGDRFVANIGHGMGIVDSSIQTFSPAFHLVVEAHPQIYLRAQKWATKHEQAKIYVVHGKWQDILLAEVQKLGRKLDGLFFDTWEETVEDLFPLLPLVLRSHGRFSFCNMYQPHDVLRHAAYSLYLAARLAAFGFSCNYRVVTNPIAPEQLVDSEKACSEVWHDVRYAYWTPDAYLVPLCAFDGEPCPANRNQVQVVRRIEADGRPSQIFIWNAKLWYLCSLLDGRRKLEPDCEKETKKNSERGSGLGLESVPEAPSLLALWERHCAAESAAAAEKAMSTKWCEAGEHTGDDELPVNPEDPTPKRRRGRSDP